MGREKIIIPYFDEGHPKLILMNSWLCVITFGIYRRKFLKRDCLIIENNILSNTYTNTKYDLSNYAKLIIHKTIPREPYIDPEKETSGWVGRDVAMYIVQKNGNREIFLPEFWIALSGDGIKEFESFLQKVTEVTNLSVEIRN